MSYSIKITLLLLSVVSTIVNSQDLFASVGFYQFNEDCFSSGSNTIDYCSSEDLVGGAFVKLNTCQIFGGFYMILENLKGNFNMTSYQDNKCTQYSDSFLLSSTDCTNFCGSFPFKISSNIVKSNDIQVPKSSVSTVVYPGKCNGDWEKSFLSIEYSHLNLCTNSIGGNYIYTCNSTSLAIQRNSFSTDCSDDAGEISIKSSCNIGGQNYQVICNE